ncbi:MAG: sigma-54 dependent transcriptional regulator [Verrucomicrobiota bacterium]|nr:sigma-54 dependent transcriptional regulator [Verrucomicrobiota bacterium]
MPIEKIIVLEDDLIVRKNLEQLLRNRRYDVAAVQTIEAANELLSKDNFDLIFVDVRLPDGEGTDLLKQLQSRPQKPLVVMMTGFGSVESAVNCMRDGAFDYIIKPFSSDQIEFTLKKAEDFTRLVKVNQYLSREEDEDTGYELLGRSPGMEQLRQLIRKVARTQATVLIQGESGTGKELVARAIYRESPRADAAFIKVNCAAIPENLIESEFFGHEKGAFTGAINKREGRFELAHGGTILLDEVSEVSPQVQAKLLRVLQERELERVGGSRTIKVDVRVIATTNRNLEQSVEKKEFRQDLFFRLNVVPIAVPPLRDRSEDIPFLAEQFMHRMARKHGVRVSGISNACLTALRSHQWPGNVRELQNVIERAVILSSPGEDLQPHHLGFMGTSSATLSSPTSIGNPSPSTSVQQTEGDEVLPLGELEKRQILLALDRCGGNRTQAAKKLGISVRTLRNKLHEYGMAGKDDAGVTEEEAA